MDIDEDFAANKADMDYMAEMEAIDNDILLFNIKIENDFGQPDSQPENTEPPKEDIYPLGIFFFDKCRIGSLFNFGSLRRPSILQEYSDINEFMSSTSNSDILRLCQNPEDKSTMIEYLFHLSFSTDDWILLSKIQQKIFALADSKPCSSLSTFIDIFIKDLPNLGVSSEKLAALGITSTAICTSDSPTINDSAKAGKFKLEAAFRHILGTLAHLLKIEENVLKTESKCDLDHLKRLVVILMISAQEPELINSILMCEFCVCINMILQLIPQDDPAMVSGEIIFYIVETVGIYWDTEMPDIFPHQTVSHICSELLPMSPQSTTLISSLSYYSLMCCLNMEDTSLVIVTNLLLKKFLSENLDKIKDLDMLQLISFTKLLNCSVNLTLDNEGEKEGLRWLLETFIKYIYEKNPKDHFAYIFKLICNQIINKWETLLS